MKILIIPNRASPFDYNKVNGGLEAIQLNIVESFAHLHSLDFLGYGNEDFGPIKLNKFSINHPLTKFSMTHISKMRKLLNSIDLKQYDVIICFEVTKSLVDVFAENGVADKIVNILATPLRATIRGIANIYRGAIETHKAGGLSYVPTSSFRHYINNVYPFIDDKGVSEELIDYEYWEKNKIVSDLLYPPILMKDKPVVQESDGTAISAQRYDINFRKTNIALNALELYNGNKIAYLPSKWGPPKKYLNLDFVKIDEHKDVIESNLKTAKVMINTCFNTGTVENASLEAISKGVPVLQLLERGNPHATLEYDPGTMIVEYEKGLDSKEILKLYSDALNNFEDSYENRINRANYLYMKYNKESYFKQWETIFRGLK